MRQRFLTKDKDTSLKSRRYCTTVCRPAIQLQLFILLFRVVTYCGASVTCEQNVNCTNCRSPANLNLNEAVMTLSKLTTVLQNKRSQLHDLFNTTENVSQSNNYILNQRYQNRPRIDTARFIRAGSNYLVGFSADLKTFWGHETEHDDHRTKLYRKMRIATKITNIMEIIKAGEEVLNQTCFCTVTDVPTIAKSSPPSFDTARRVLEKLGSAMKILCRS